MLTVIMTLAESAANGGWPAAFALSAIALAGMGCFFAVCWSMVRM